MSYVMSFLQLETLTNVSAAEKDAIQTLAVAVFKANSPADPAKLPEPYVKCLEVGTPYRACVISGRYDMTLIALRVFCFPGSYCLPFIGSSFLNQGHPGLPIPRLQGLPPRCAGERADEDTPKPRREAEELPIMSLCFRDTQQLGWCGRYVADCFLNVY